jgi:glycosyltransferase involved in cell wall biosynthesis
MATPRLLFLTENHPPDRGGMAESCDRIVRGLTRAGAAVDLVHFDRKSVRLTRRETSSGVQLRVPLDADASHTINLLWNRLQQEVELQAITHVMAFGGFLPLLAAPAFAALMERPLITLLRGNELDAGLFDPRRRPLLDDALLRSAAVCTVTTAQSAKIAALHPRLQPRVIANGIDFDLWQATDADRVRGSAWRTANVAPDRRLIGLFGHLKSKKGVPFFVESLVRSGVADRVHLLLIGEIDEALRATLDACDVARTELPSVGRFELLPYYLACDFIAIPSHYDGFPNVLIEAMALGKPLLASAVGGMRDVLTEGEDAFLFPPGHDHACRDAIRRAVDADGEALLQMGAHAAAVARGRCDAREETRCYLEVLHDVQEESDANAALDRHPFPAPHPLWRRAR